MNNAPNTLIEARRVTKSYLLGRRTLEVLKGRELERWPVAAEAEAVKAFLRERSGR